MAGLMAAAGSLFKGVGLAQGLQIGGTILSTAGAINAGNAQRDASNFQAAQLEAAAKAEQAAAQRDAEQERKKITLLMSRARAVGAASGGGQDFNLLGDIAEEGEYNALIAQWQGNEAASGRRMQASASRMEGSAAQKAGRLKGSATLLSSAPTFTDAFDTIAGSSRTFREKYG
jgi:hypothetical protein